MFIAHQLTFYELFEGWEPTSYGLCNSTICTMLVLVRPRTLNPILDSAY